MGNIKKLILKRIVLFIILFFILFSLVFAYYFMNNQLKNIMDGIQYLNEINKGISDVRILIQNAIMVEDEAYSVFAAQRSLEIFDKLDKLGEVHPGEAEQIRRLYTEYYLEVVSIKSLFLENKMDFVAGTDLFIRDILALNTKQNVLRQLSMTSASIEEDISKLIKNRIVEKDKSILFINISIIIITGLLLIGFIEIFRYEKAIIKAKEQAEAANITKGSFLANMRQEIRTPMNAIIGMAYLAQQTELTQAQSDYIAKIKSSAEGLLGIINDILDFSKIEAGEIILEEKEFNVDEIFESVSDMIVLKASEKQIEVVFDFSSDIPYFLIGDPLRIKQVLTNLLNNAVKFTHEGEIILTVKVLKKQENNITLLFSVRDTGEGIPAEKINNLFKPFSQTDETVTRKYGGTGLGLSICKDMVEMMGGKIWVESVVGEGSTFSFTLELGIGQGQKDLFTKSIQNLKGTRALIVDDNRPAREVLKAMLTELSFKVKIACSGEEALHIIHEQPENEGFDIILMDWRMPGMDGIETAYKIKKTEGLTKIPAILMITSYDLNQVKKDPLFDSIDGYLTKPVNQSTLYDTIVKILSKNGFEVREVKETKLSILDESIKKISGSSILLVEDNEINQQIAKEFLEKAGLEVEVADNGIKAIEALDKKDYDLILMDIQMPEMDGIEATKRIRSIDKYKKIPIVAMTAHAMSGDREKSLNAGMDDHINKPIVPETLYSSLLKWIPDTKSNGTKKQLSSNNMQSREALSEIDLLDIEVLNTIDTKNVLKNLSCNKKLYIKLLIEFYDSFNKHLDKIKKEIQDNNIDVALNLVHGIKGVSGNLGAVSLYERAADLEEQLYEGQKTGIDECFVSFSEEFMNVMNELETLLNRKFDQ